MGVPQPVSAADGKFVNISTRALSGTGDEAIIGRFVIEEGGQQVLIQAVGPELAAKAGISNALADPVLTITNTTDPGNPVELMVNDNWEDSQGQLISDLWEGSPNLTAGSLSAAAALTLEPGNYTAKVEGKYGTAGVALIEVYGIESPDTDGKFVNPSTRALVGTGEEGMFGGFIIREGSKQVLIQAVGPELAVNGGISNALVDPVLTVIDTTDPGNPVELMVNDNWEDSQGQLISDLWGGNPNLTAGSLSSAAVLTLEPGNYTAKVEGKDGTAGVAMVELYGIDFSDAGTPDTQQLDLTLDARSVPPPVIPSWSAETPIDSDFEPAHLIGPNKRFGGSVAKSSQSQMGGTAPRPNIVVILSDDMGWGQPGFNGGTEVATPNMDRIADEGVKLTQFYVQPVCTATRASLLTGRYPWKNGTENRVGLRSKFGMLTDERTIAEALGEASYATWIVGKWHLGQWQKAHLPLQRGFDHHYGLYGGEINSFSHHRGRTSDRTLDWHRNERPVVESGYSTFLLAEEAIQLIERHDGANPFFLYLPFNAVHNPNDAPQEYIDLYDHLDNPKQRAQLKAMDVAIGWVLDALEGKGVLDDTLVMFLNDNGGVSSAGWNAPYRGKKSEFHEGGILVPAVLRWPGEITGGSSSDALLHVVDLFPTLAGLAGASTSGGQPLDGVDAWDAISNGAESPRAEMVPSLKVIRNGDWKLIDEGIDYYGFTTDAPELYNLAEDPYEETNLASSQSAKVAQLRARLTYHSDFARSGEADEDIPNFPPRIYGEAENTAFAAAVAKAVRERNAGNPGPALVRMEGSGTQLRLIYDEALDADSAPPPSAFKVVETPGYTSVAVTAVTVSGSSVELSLARAPTVGNTVGLTYEVPDSGAIRDEDELEAVGRTWIAATVRSNDATLSSIQLTYDDSGTATDTNLSPRFATGTTTYTAWVANDVSEITLNLTAGNANATVEYLDESDTVIADADGTADGQQVALSEGSNTVKIRVTAEDGLAVKTYTVIVTRGTRWTTTMTIGDSSGRGYSNLPNPDVGSLEDDTFEHANFTQQVQITAATSVGVTFRTRAGGDTFGGLVLEWAGEVLPLDEATRSRNTFTWDQTWLDANASSLNISNYETTLPAGGTTTVCIRSSTRTCSSEAPLTATFQDVPEEHDGSSSFTLELAFTEELAARSRAKLLQAISVTGGTMTQVQRAAPPQRDRWEITVAPSGDGEVTLSLPSTSQPCSSASAVCTEDGKALSEAVSVTVTAAGT